MVSGETWRCISEISFFFFFVVHSAWRSATREITSPCAQCVTEPAATGNWSRLAARPGPATCSTMQPPSSSPSLWHYGVSSSVLLSCSLARFVAAVHQLLCLHILRADLIWQMLEEICALVLHVSLIPLYSFILTQRLSFLKSCFL